LHRYHPHPKFLPHPAKHISIRGADDDKYTIIDVTRVGLPDGVPRILEEIELSRAIFEVYEGGVVRHQFPLIRDRPLRACLQFLHQGLTFIVSMMIRAHAVSDRCIG
jgi:hypothetical protein